MVVESIVGHELCNEKPLLTLTTESNQLCQPLVLQLSYSSRLLLIKTWKVKGRFLFLFFLFLKRRIILVTANCLGSGHAALVNFLTAIHRVRLLVSISFPLYTKLMAPFSDRNLLELKLSVAIFKTEKENSEKAASNT